MQQQQLRGQGPAQLAAQQRPISNARAPFNKHARLLQRPVLQQTPQQQQQEIVPLLSLSSLHPDLQQLVQQRQQQQQQQQAVDLLPHLLCELQPAALTSRIKQCRTWNDAAVLFAQQAPCLNHINLSALLVQLAHLPGPASSRPANWEAFVRQVLASLQFAVCSLQFAQPRQLSNMAWALAKLGLRDWAGGPWQIGADSSSSSNIDSVGAHDETGFSASAWGDAWQQCVVDSLHSASCRDVSNILWALATTTSSSSSSAATGSDGPQQQQRWQQQQLQPPGLSHHSRLVQELLSALHRTLPSSKPQDAANALWALATLQILPSSELLSFLLVRLQSHFPDLKPREVATTLWALSQLQAVPPSSWLQECLLRQVGRQQWQHTQARHWVMCLTACAHLKQVPPTPWLTECLGKLQGYMAEAVRSQPQQQQQQQQQPPAQRSEQQDLQHPAQQAAQQQATMQHAQQQQQQHTAAVHLLPHEQQAGSCDASNQLADAIVAALAGSNYSSTSSSSSSSSRGARAHDRAPNSCTNSSSSSSSSSSHTAARTAPGQMLSTQDLSTTIWALATLHIKPNGSWMGAFSAASAASMTAASPQELVNCVWGLQMLRVVPDASWLAAFDAASMACMPSFTPQGLGDILAAQVRLGLKPSWAWGEAWASALKASWGSADASAVCKTLWAAAKCQLPLGRAWLGEALQQVHKPLLLPALATGGLTNEELLRLMWAVGRLCKGNLSQELSDLLGLYCCRAAGKMSGVQLARGAWGLARLVPLPREGLLRYYHDLAASKLKYLPEAQGVELQHKLSLLKDAAANAELYGTHWRVVLKKAQEQQQLAHAALHQVAGTTLDDGQAGAQVAAEGAAFAEAAQQTVVVAWPVACG